MGDRRAAPSDTLLVEFVMAELQRARERIAELEAVIATYGCGCGRHDDTAG